ncbi:LysR substrate-binding domain-containing protein [Thiotrichales bacterium 19S3-7]|nr:LysR substrate-binding domain-containing protein [Thiotrichales bacterium 19S3-7]MCF6802457.1 LysR substrate-binding domain-containing protein [Thiotrichales bacterium 19S3-11]
MRRKINLEVLELLDIIDKKGSFSSAAEALYKAPSAITYAIQKLEGDLNIQLFQKKGRQVEMTPAARVLLEKGRDILESVDLLQQRVIETDAGWEPKITIAVNTMLGVEYCFPEVKELYQIRPDIEITLREEALGGLWDNVINDQADLTIGAAGMPGHEVKGLDIVKIGHVNIHLVAAKDHPLAQLDRPITVNDIKHCRFVTNSNTGITPRPDITLSKKSALRVPTIQDKLHAIVDGLGIGFMPDISIKYFASKGEIVVLPYGKESVPLCSTLYLISKKSNQGKAKNWFVEKFRKKSFEQYRIY